MSEHLPMMQKTLSGGEQLIIDIQEIRARAQEGDSA